MAPLERQVGGTDWREGIDEVDGKLEPSQVVEQAVDLADLGYESREEEFEITRVSVDEVLRALGDKYAVAPAFLRLLEDGEREIYGYDATLNLDGSVPYVLIVRSP